MIKNRESKPIILDYEIMKFLIYEEKQAFLITYFNSEYSLVLYDFNTFKTISWCSLPSHFEPCSICLNDDSTRLLIIAYRAGTQDLAPNDKSSFECLPYQEHYLYTVEINKFKVNLDGKLNKSTWILANAKKMQKDLIHLTLLKDDYFIGCTTSDIVFLQFDYDLNTLVHIDSVPTIHLDGSEHDQLQKSMTTKLQK